MKQSSKKENEMKVTYTYKLPEGMSEEKAQKNLDDAYDILFNELFRQKKESENNQTKL